MKRLKNAVCTYTDELEKGRLSVKSTFSFSKDLQVILYGANVCAERLSRLLFDAGYRVAAVLDRRYAELESACSAPVYGLEDHPFMALDKAGLCVVITLQNAMQHEPIALELLRQGFHKILFVPMKSRLEEQTAQTLRFQYNLLLAGEFQMLKEVPVIEEAVIRPEIDTGRAVIREEGGLKIIWCPAELLYTNPPRLCAEPAIRRYANVPLHSYYPYVSLFEYLRGMRSGVQQYLDEYGVNSCKYKTPLTNTEVVLQRKRLLEIYKDALNRGMDFFISSAPPAEWNAQYKVFNLLEGQHRSLFLAMEGFRYIPIRVSQRDFEEWNRPCPDAGFPNWTDNSEESPHVLHPRYHWINENSDRNDLLQLESIQEYLGGAGSDCQGMLEGRAVLDLSGTCGYYARNALRMRAERAVLYAPEGKGTAQIIHALEGFKGLLTVDNWSEAAKEAYHVLFAMSALMDLPLDQKRLWMERCDRICLDKCFVIVKDMAEAEAWKTFFSRVETLRPMFARGETAVLCVLRK